MLIYKKPDDVDEIIEDLHEEVLEESANTFSSVKSHVDKLLSHMIKYYSQRTIQTRSWIITIRNSVTELNELVPTLVTADRRKFEAYVKDEAKAMSTAVNIVTSAATAKGNTLSNPFPHSDDMYFTFDELFDAERINEFLKTYAYTNAAQKELGLPRSFAPIDDLSTYGLDPESEYRKWKKSIRR